MAVKRRVKYVITKLDGTIGASWIKPRHTVIFTFSEQIPDNLYD